MQRAMKAQCSKKLDVTRTADQQEEPIKRVVHFLIRMFPAAHYDGQFLRNKVIRHLQYMRQRSMPSKQMEEDDDFNDVSDIDLRYKPRTPKPPQEAPKPVLDLEASDSETDKDAQAEEVQNMKAVKAPARNKVLAKTSKELVQLRSVPAWMTQTAPRLLTLVTLLLNPRSPARAVL